MANFPGLFRRNCERKIYKKKNVYCAKKNQKRKIEKSRKQRKMKIKFKRYPTREYALMRYHPSLTASKKNDLALSFLRDEDQRKMEWR